LFALRPKDGVERPAPPTSRVHTQSSTKPHSTITRPPFTISGEEASLDENLSLPASSGAGVKDHAEVKWKGSARSFAAGTAAGRAIALATLKLDSESMHLKDNDEQPPEGK
jgi:hypothetical protein